MEYLFVMPRSQQYLLKALLSNCSLLSEMSVWGIPNQVTIFFQTNFLASASLIFTMVIVCEATSVVLIVWMDVIVYSKGLKGLGVGSYGVLGVLGSGCPGKVSLTLLCP